MFSNGHGVPATFFRKINNAGVLPAAGGGWGWRVVSIQRCHLTRIGNPIEEIRRADDSLISTTGRLILVRHIYNKSWPCPLCTVTYNVSIASASTVIGWDLVYMARCYTWTRGPAWERSIIIPIRGIWTQEASHHAMWSGRILFIHYTLNCNDFLPWHTAVAIKECCLRNPTSRHCTKYTQLTLLCF